MMRLARYIVASLLAGLAATTSSFSAEPVRVVSTSQQQNIAAAGNSYMPAFSANGRFLVFLSDANNLVTNDGGKPFLDVFIRDLAASNTMLVSASSSGFGGGDDNSLLPVVSSNGQFVAFESAASNLVPGDTSKVSDVFVRDIVGQTTVLASVNTFGRSGNAASANASISADGRFVAFESSASDLVTNDLNGQSDVFVRDLQTGTTLLVSVDATGQFSGRGRSERPQISADGRRVLFLSTATNLLSDQATSGPELYIRDLESHDTFWVTTNLAASLTNIAASLTNIAASLTNPSGPQTWTLSQSGLSGIFTIGLTNSSGTLLFYFDLTTGTSAWIPAAANALLTDDGSRVVFSGTFGIYIWDAETHSSRLAIPSPPGFCGGQGTVGGPSGFAVLRWISAGAEAIAYRIRDCITDSAVVLTNLSRGESTVIFDPGSMASFMDPKGPLVLNPSGTMLAFESEAESIVAGDYNKASDIFLRDVATSQTELISRSISSRPATTGIASSRASRNSLSADGQVLVFSSFDNYFAQFDTNNCEDLFAKDLGSGLVTGVSIVPTNFGYPNPIGPFWTNHFARNPSITADGRYVAFELADSAQSQGAQGLVSANYDVFLHDRQQRRTVFISTNAPNSGGADFNTSSKNPVVSPDGRFVAFESRGQYLLSLYSDPQRPNNFSAVYFRVIGTNRLQGTNYVSPLVSANRTNSANGNGDSVRPLISPNGRWLLFYSSATDLTMDVVTSNSFRLYGRDLLSGQAGLLSYDEQGLPLNANVTNAVITGDSRYVFFEVANSAKIYRCELLSPSPVNFLACSGCANPSASADGRFIVYQPSVGGAPGKDVLVKDLQTGEAKLVSANYTGNGGANAPCTSAQISGDARYVVFASKASDLVENDRNEVSDIFVRDLRLGITLLISGNSSGGRSANAVSSNPVLGPDGRTIAFQSFASDLVDGDFNNTRDVFVVRLGGTDSDHDGMDDDWEMAYFNTLARDGTGDLDHDGQTDLQEFLAGTDPTNSGSILQVLTLRRLSDGGVTILWSATPGRTYTLQFKNRVDDVSWSSLDQNVRATASTVSFQDNSASAQAYRFYRVVLVQ